MNHSEQINELAGALAKAQGQLATAKKNAKNPFLKNDYADLTAVWDAARGPLAANGLSVVQPADIDEHGNVTVTTVLAHSSGQWMTSALSMAPDAEKGLSMAQVAGKIISYLRRYGLMSLVGITAEGEDDDGNDAQGKVVARKPAPKAEPHWIMDSTARARFWAKTSDMGLTHGEVHRALDVNSLKGWNGTEDQAYQFIDAWLDARTEAAVLDDHADEIEQPALVEA